MSYQPVPLPPTTATTRRRHHEQPSHQFYHRPFAGPDVGEPYRSRRAELSTQLYDASSTYGGLDHNHSTSAIDSMRRLSTTAQAYGRENHVKRNLGDWVDVFECLGSAELKTRKLLDGLSDLRLPAPAHEIRGFPGSLNTTGGSPASSQSIAGSNSTMRRHGARSLPAYNSHYRDFGNPAIAAAPLVTTRGPSMDHSGYVMRQETTSDGPPTVEGAVRVKRAQLVDNLIDTAPYMTVADLSEDNYVRTLCSEVRSAATKGIEILHELPSDFLRASSTWESVVSSMSKSTNTLYTVISATANIVGDVVQGMDSGTKKATLGGISSALKEAAGYLQRKIEDPTNTKTTAANAHSAAEELRYNAHMFLMAYIELQAIVNKILDMRQDGGSFSEKDKEHIARFFYSFGRHFDTMPNMSIQHTAEQERRKFEESRSGKRAAATITAADSEGSTSRQNLPLYNQDGRVRTYDQLPRRH